MKLLAIIVVLLSFVLASPAPVSACSCIPPPPPRTALEEAGAVFSGTVTEVSRAQRSSSGPLSGSLGMKATFTVDRSWKNVTTPTVTIETGIGDGDCGFTFEKEKTYLVYTEGPNPRSTNICLRTAELASASNDLPELGPPMTTFSSSSQPTNAKSVNPRMVAGIATAALIFTLAYRLAKRWDEKHRLK